MTETETKKRSRPRKRLAAERQPVHEPIHSALRDEGFEYTPYEVQNPLHIDEELIRNIKNDYDFVLQWVAESVTGQPQDQSLSARRKNGFAEVHRGHFGGMLDSYCNRDSRIEKGGLVLMARPAFIEGKARAYEKRAARGAVEQVRKKHGETGVDVKGGNHPSALEKNRHKQTFERVDIPE
jgi:hypothetical protein